MAKAKGRKQPDIQEVKDAAASKKQAAELKKKKPVLKKLLKFQGVK